MIVLKSVIFVVCMIVLSFLVLYVITYKNNKDE